MRTLPVAQLAVLAAEARRFLIESVSETGGHLAANLGAVELTIALHHVFNTPDDRLVWDVGHQSYLHKILTGRRRRMDSLRQKDGLAGFPKRAESLYDNFGVGHSSTSISAGLGMALASLNKGEERRIVSVIGDGAMTAGMAFEALNHGGSLDPNMLVVLNENQMSISPNVGAITKVLARMMIGPTVTNIRERGKQMMHKDSRVWRFMSRWEEHVKGMVMPSTLFEELGFNYLGPIDGHDLDLPIGEHRQDEGAVEIQDLAGPLGTVVGLQDFAGPGVELRDGGLVAERHVDPAAGRHQSPG